jgi:hypothetical protein
MWTSKSPPFVFPGRLLATALLLVLAAGIAAAPQRSAVLLYDGKLPDQVALADAARKAFAPFTARVPLRTLHAGRAESVPFLKRFGMTRRDAPVLLVMDGAGSRILRRVAVRADVAAEDATRTMLAAVGLPRPRPELVSGSLAAFETNGGADEKPFLIRAAGGQQLMYGGRHLQSTGAVIYRLQVPDVVRRADLRLEVAGHFAVDTGESPNGPWTPLIDGYGTFGPAEEAVKQRVKPVVELSGLLRELAGPLYLRFRTDGRGTNRAELYRVELVALGPNDASDAPGWEQERARIRQQALAGVLPKGSGTPFAGTLREDTRLEAGLSPYVMTGEVVVPRGVTLTIDPGVLVRVAGPFALLVQGTLLANGVPGKPIVFTPVAARQPDDWKGIRIQGPPAGTASRLQYCRITNAAAVELQRFNGEVFFCSFEGCACGLLLQDGGKAQLRHNRFTRCMRGIIVDEGGAEATLNHWDACMVAIQVSALRPSAPLKLEQNSIVGSRIAAVSYTLAAGSPKEPLVLSNNYWADTPPEKLQRAGAAQGEVRFEPKLAAPPQGVGPGR